MTIFPVFKQLRLAELITEQWGNDRIPDLLEVYKVIRPTRLLEIGCYRGVSTEFWLLHCEQVIAVDPWPEPAVRRQFLNRCGHYPHLVRLEGHSPQVFMGRTQYPFKDLDMVYVDGDHSYDAVKADVIATLPYLHDYGYMAGHDYYLPDVTRALREMFTEVDDVYSDGSWHVRVKDPEELAKDIKEGIRHDRAL